MYENYEFVENYGRRVFFELDEDRTIIYSPSGQYYRIQDKRVQERLTLKYSKAVGEKIGSILARNRSYVGLIGEDYEDIEKEILDNYKDLEPNQLDDLIEEMYQNRTHFIDDGE